VRGMWRFEAGTALAASVLERGDCARWVGVCTAVHSQFRSSYSKVMTELASRGVRGVLRTSRRLYWPSAPRFSTTVERLADGTSHRRAGRGTIVPSCGARLGGPIGFEWAITIRTESCR